MVDNKPELLVGDPFGDYKALTCIAHGAIAKGDLVSIVADQSSYTDSDYTTVVATSTSGEYAFGVAMKAAADTAYVPVLWLGIVKVTSAWADIDAGDSLLPYSGTGQTFAGVKTTTAKAGCCRSMQDMASGDTGLVLFNGGVA